MARKRGRWTMSSALQRYTKTQVLIQRRPLLQADQIDEGERSWHAPGMVMSKAPGKSRAADKPLTVSLIAALSQLSGDGLESGCAASRARPEVGRPRTGGKALFRRQGAI
eukprot:9236568-Pyramimonas_sp.AAC.1